MKAAWATDIHLRFVDPDEREVFYRELIESECDVILLTGDLGGECDLQDGQREPLAETETAADLKELAEAVRRPIYFVLGNHDYYRSSFAAVRQAVHDLCQGSDFLHFVQQEGVAALTETTAIVGHECWGDAGWGDFLASQAMLSDWKVIWEPKQYWKRADPTADLAASKLTMADLDQSALAAELQRLGQEAADHLRKALPDALARYEDVLVLCHAPPFLQSIPRRWRGHPDDCWPTMVCRAAGEVLLEVAPQYPDRQLQILAGHTHDAQRFRVTKNMTMSIGAAEYMAPCIEAILDIR